MIMTYGITRNNTKLFKQINCISVLKMKLYLDLVRLWLNKLTHKYFYETFEYHPTKFKCIIKTNKAWI